jgi:Fur family ferric uptake transcriptional regulator
VLPVSQTQAQLNPAPEIKEVPAKKIIRELGQDVFETVAAENPDIGFATVYRFLKNLSTHNFVTEVRMGGMPARYEWASRRHHDHLTCSECGKVVEFESDQIEALQEKIAQNLGFRLTGHLLELFGVCPACQKNAK